MTRAGVIGRDGQLPWRLSADLKRFKSLTMGHHLIMGRKTFDSLGKILPGRVSIVLKRLSSPYDYTFVDDSGSSMPLYQGQGVPSGVEAINSLPLAFAHSLDEARRLAQIDSEVFVIGGGEIYSQTLPLVERMYITWVEAEIDGDTHFPAWNPCEWRLVSEERHSADAKNQYDYSFATYTREL